LSAEKDGKPPLADLVRQGDAQKEAEPINDFIFMVKDISNAYLINTADGDVLVNTGFMDNTERNKALFAPVRKGPLRKIILTQAHPDHYGGVPVFKEPGTQVIAEVRFKDTWKFFDELGPFLGRRSGKLWASTMKRSAAPAPPPHVVADIEVDREFTFEQGGRKFVCLSTPGGESLCSLTVWMPNEKIAFTGNLFGPVFLSMPFLTTIRGDKPRLVANYLWSLDRVRALGVETLITGHGEPIKGADKVKAALDKMHAAVSSIRKQTVEGMNAGKDVHTLMRDVKLPDDLKIGEFHGNVRWAVRAIWEEHAGWFHYDSTTSLYGVPRKSVDADVVELAGGADKLAARAQAKLDGGKPLEAMHLLDIALGVEPANAAALKVKQAVLGKLLAESGGQNLSETMWLKSEIAAIEAALGAN
jgi:glyoxylase-like metal-dependent hydrolase (beta-lactamase superfamily II)